MRSDYFTHEELTALKQRVLTSYYEKNTGKKPHCGSRIWLRNQVWGYVNHGVWWGGEVL